MAISKIQSDSITDSAVTSDKISGGAIGISDLGTQVQGALGTRNLIINGDMRIAQRGTSTTGITAGNNFVLDRFIFNTGSMGTWTLSQDTDAPDSFSNSMKLQCTTANASPTGTNWCNFQQRIEAQNLQHLAYGTASAKTITLSFWVKSNKTGTYTTMIYGYDSTPARTISAEYTISAANTWEKKTVTYTGDISGQIDNDNGAGFNIYWALGTGPDRQSSPLQTSWGTYDSTAFISSSQVNLADTVNNYINITGVQLEIGDTATPFEHRPYDMELARCQRYCFRWNVEQTADNICMLALYSSTNAYGVFRFPVQMRAFPTFTISDAAHFRCTRAGSNVTLTDLSIAEQSTRSAQVLAQASGGIGTVGHAGWLRHNGGLLGTEFLQFDAEL